jgi:hypothetical protein
MKQIILRELGGARRSKVVLLVSTDETYPLPNIIQVSMYDDSAKVAIMNAHEPPITLELNQEQMDALVSQWQEWQVPRCTDCGTIGTIGPMGTIGSTLHRCESCQSLFCEACGAKHTCKPKQ